MMLRQMGFLCREALHLDGGCVLHRLREIVVHLQTEPDFRTAAERFVETDCHIRRDAALPIHEVVQRLPGNP